MSTDLEWLHERRNTIHTLLLLLQEAYTDNAYKKPSENESGFVSRLYVSCEDCAYNGFVSRDCENCEGTGRVEVSDEGLYDPYADKSLRPTFPEPTRLRRMLKNQEEEREDLVAAIKSLPKMTPKELDRAIERTAVQLGERNALGRERFEIIQANLRRCSRSFPKLQRMLKAMPDSMMFASTSAVALYLSLCWRGRLYKPCGKPSCSVC